MSEGTNGKKTEMKRQETPRGGMRMGGYRGPAEKPKEFKKTWARLLRYCGQYLPIIIVSLIASGFGTFLHVLGPDRIGDIVDEIQKGLFAESVNIEKVAGIAALVLTMYLTAAVLGFLQQYIMATVTAKVARNLRDGISRKINRLPLSYFDKTQVGDVISRATNDVDTIGGALSQSVGSMMTSGIMLFGSLFMMFLINWILALITVSTALLGFAAMIIIMKNSHKYFRDQQKGLGEINGHIEEMFSGHIIVKAYNGGDDAKKVFDGINETLYVTSWKSQFLSGFMMPIMQFSANLAYVAVCIGGAVMAANGTMGVTFGVIISFIVYLRLFINPLAQLAQSIPNIQRAAAAGERVFAFFDEAEMEDESAKTAVLGSAGTAAFGQPLIRGEVEFKDVKFGYTEDKTIIHGFSAKVSPGQKIAIVGPTGAGKTTIVNLLMRFYEIGGGEILLDGTPIDSVRRENVHEQFCMVLQDTWLFQGTIKENVIYSKTGVTDDDVKAACKAAGIHHFIRTLPEGYDTVLNDNASLSAGQRQLLTIARAIIQNAPLLILDEATSSVDTRTEILIQKAMDKLTEGRTSFVIAHRLSTVKNADLILVMRDGDIVESGAHEELLAGGGFYAELYNSQFEVALV